ncbi:hypothetical protein FHR84_002133 [Actinopolyspora biskrensis]|uniref:Uncharacterized protein n=1 Tax=Actinopolyspora biskrensis TaxID=1470178 RepID=A0A852YXH5_9ACTN|nr:hypothetical protein [Actinopolyspora biskrensis]NYH78808.1 hypothetical protein [Actinopolyspora biskrensis]
MPNKTASRARNVPHEIAQYGENTRAYRSQLAERVDALRADKRYSDEYRATLIEQVRAEYRDHAARLRSLLDHDRQQAREAAEQLDRPGDVNAQLLAETRQQRAWNRVRPCSTTAVPGGPCSPKLNEQVTPTPCRPWPPSCPPLSNPGAPSTAATSVMLVKVWTLARSAEPRAQSQRACV